MPLGAYRGYYSKILQYCHGLFSDLEEILNTSYIFIIPENFGIPEFQKSIFSSDSLPKVAC